MKISDHERTFATQEYIYACDKFWDVFISSKSLKETNIDQIMILNDVTKYFQDWQKSLVPIFKKKAEQAKNFISWQTMFDLMARPLYTII